MWTYFGKNVEVEFMLKKNRVRKREKKKKKRRTREKEIKQKRKREGKKNSGWMIGSDPNPIHGWPNEDNHLIWLHQEYRSLS